MGKIKKLIGLFISTVLLASFTVLPVRAATPNISVHFERIYESPVDVTFRATLTNASPQPERGITMTTLFEGLSFPITSLNQIKVEQVKKESYLSNVSKLDTSGNVTGYTQVTRYREAKSNFKNWSFQGVNPNTAASITLPGYNADRDGWGGGVLVLDFTIKTGLIGNELVGWGSSGVLVLDIDGTQYKDLLHSSWWNNNWSYRNSLSFNASSISSNLTNFPVKVTLSASNFDFTKANGNGSDVRFVDSDNTTSLPYEFEHWDSGVNQTAVAWVQIPQINASSNYTDNFYIYYGYITAVDAQNPNAVWASTNATLVWHLGSDNNSGATIYDSTSYGHNGTATGTTWTRDGKLFNGVGDYVTATYTTLDNSLNVTFSIDWWGQITGASGILGGIVSKDQNDVTYWDIAWGSNTLIYLWNGVNSDGWFGIPSLSANKAHFVMVVDNTTATLYRNGVSLGNNTIIQLPSSARPFYVGRGFSVGGGLWHYLAGTIGEVRSYNRIVSAMESKADYMNQINSLISYGARVSAIPAVTTNNAQNITTISFLGSGNLDNVGSGNVTQVGFEWGTTSGVYTNNSTTVGSYVAGEFHATISGLSANTTYYFRALAVNNTGAGYGSEKTATTFGYVASFRGVVQSDTMILTWEKGSSSTNTTVRYRTDRYPTSAADGTLLYHGIGYQATASNLTAGQVYYFTAFSYDNATAPSTALLALNTMGVDIPSGAQKEKTAIIPIPIISPSVDQPANVPGINLEPFTTIIAVFATDNATSPGGLGVPVANMWEILTMAGLTMIGVSIYGKSKNFFLAWLVVFILTIFAVALHLTQGWLVVGELIVGGGVWAIDKYFQ